MIEGFKNANYSEELKEDLNRLFFLTLNASKYTLAKQNLSLSTPKYL